MLAQAVASGSPTQGALRMAAFIVGTSPLFFTLALGITILKGGLERSFTKLAAAALIFMGMVNLNSALALTGAPYTFDAVIKNGLFMVFFSDYY
jgi:sulfite exporter TauE/SafE